MPRVVALTPGIWRCLSPAMPLPACRCLSRRPWSVAPPLSRHCITSRTQTRSGPTPGEGPVVPVTAETQHTIRVQSTNPSCVCRRTVLESFGQHTHTCSHQDVAAAAVQIPPFTALHKSRADKFYSISLSVNLHPSHGSVLRTRHQRARTAAEGKEAVRPAFPPSYRTSQHRRHL